VLSQEENRAKRLVSTSIIHVIPFLKLDAWTKRTLFLVPGKTKSQYDAPSWDWLPWMCYIELSIPFNESFYCIWSHYHRHGHHACMVDPMKFPQLVCWSIESSLVRTANSAKWMCRAKMTLEETRDLQSTHHDGFLQKRFFSEWRERFMVVQYKIYT